MIDRHNRAWQAALAGGHQLWYEYLDRVMVCDGVSFAYDQQTPEHLGGMTLPDLLRQQLIPESRVDVPGLSEPMKLLYLTIEHLGDRIRTALEEAFDERDERKIPREGVLQYFGDDLRFCLYIHYRSGSLAQLLDLVPLINPVLIADPVQLVNEATSDRELEVVRRAIYSASKLVMLRNVVVHVHREISPTVFGPSIDTLIVADWLMTHRFASQRLNPELRRFFQDPLSRAATTDLSQEGSAVIEVGSGSGMILATFTKNEARLKRFEAADVNLDAIISTYNNTYRQRQIHGGWISDNGNYTVGRFDDQAHQMQYDLVVCNPPYVPAPPRSDLSGTHAIATLGTELLEELLRRGASLLREGGEMLLVMSNLTQMTLARNLPASLKAEKLLAKVVPFRLEGLRLDREPEVVAFLRKNGLKAVRQRGATRYTHEVRLYRITRNEESTCPE